MSYLGLLSQSPSTHLQATQQHPLLQQILFPQL